MDSYLLLKVVHILSATVLVGTGFGTAFYMWSASRQDNLHVIAHVNQRVVLADWWFTTPAVIIQPVTGFWMLSISGQDMFQYWVLVSLVLYVIVGLCWLPVVWLQLRMRDMAREAIDQNAPGLPSTYTRYMRRWFILGWPAFTGVIIIYFLMVFRPV